MKQSSSLYKSFRNNTQSLITRPAETMTMAAHKIALAACFLSFLSFISANSTESAKASSCSGPIRYYEDLGCTPVFKTPDSPCPERYNCDHLKNSPADKCVVNGHEYAVGEKLRDEDKNPCDLHCTCIPGSKGPQFTCAVLDCSYLPPKLGCYRRHNPSQCCPSTTDICPEKPEDIPTCKVDGKVYKDGEYFVPESEPKKICYCGPGYEGKNVAPFCHEYKMMCGTMLRHAHNVRENCSPTFYHSQSPKTSCSVAYRCQNSNDVVIARSNKISPDARSGAPIDPDMKCTFGNLTMNIGDELNQATDYDSVCVKCVCEVPPVPTCQRLSDEECDVTKHPDFSATSRRR